jgi:hypothetical protein
MLQNYRAENCIVDLKDNRQQSTTSRMIVFCSLANLGVVGGNVQSKLIIYFTLPTSSHAFVFFCSQLTTFIHWQGLGHTIAIVLNGPCSNHRATVICQNRFDKPHRSEGATQAAAPLEEDRRLRRDAITP